MRAVPLPCDISELLDRFRELPAGTHASHALDLLIANGMTASTASIGQLARVGAAARAASLTPERRAQIAREAARARWRPVKAHQRIIRERAEILEPRAPLPTLDGCSVQQVTRETARPIILRYEWLGTMGRARAWYGLHAPDGEVLGVVGFGHGIGAASRNLCGPESRELTICLERGACVHYAPRNAGSFLIARACRLAHRDHGWEIFYAYADPDAGEIGTIYQALGWDYIGQGAGRTPGRKRDQFLRPNGTRVDERTLRHGGVKMGDVLGWRRVQSSPKHRYVHFAAAELRARCRFEFQPYPKRRQRRRS